MTVYAGTIEGELKFNGWEGLTSYDISTTKNCCYNDGIHRIYPADVNGYNTGCYRYPCDDVYHFVGDSNAIHSINSDNMVAEIGLENRALDDKIEPARLVRQASYPGLPAIDLSAQLSKFNLTRPN